MTTLDMDRPALMAADHIEDVLNAMAGSESAFTGLFAAYSKRVFDLVRHSARDWTVAEDICQDIWLKVYREIRSLRKPEAFAAWLFRVAARACIEHARSRKVHAGLEESELVAHISAQPEHRAEESETVLLAWEAMGSLTARQNIALYLRQVETRSYREIADLMGCPESAVETLLFRARRSFSKSYDLLAASRESRCENAHRAMMALTNGQVTPFHEQTIRSHASSCAPCRVELMHALAV